MAFLLLFCPRFVFEELFLVFFLLMALAELLPCFLGSCWEAASEPDGLLLAFLAFYVSLPSD